MILFDLRCSQNHGFEAWFRDGASFERLAAAGEISCAICGDRKVEKALMAPAVRTTASLAPPPAAESGTGDKPGKESATSPSAQSGNAQSEGARSEGTVVPEDAGRHDPPDLSKMAAGPEKLMQAMHLLRQAQDHIQKNFEHVGKSFPEEARKIHYGETEERAIYGEATKDEAETLAEEGIDVGQIPWLPLHNS